MNTTEVPSQCIDWCNKLLRGERSAVETYEIALEKHADHSKLGTLRDIAAEHRQSVGDLEANIREMGGSPDSDSGAWGEFAKAIEKAATLFGPESTIEALKKGEEHGQKDYQEALASGDLTPACQDVYRGTLLPRIRKHLMELETLKERVD